MTYLPLAREALLGAAGLSAGLVCGVINLRLLSAATLRLSGSQSAKSFVISSFFRVSVFAIVAGAFAAFGSWQALALYIVGLFVPIAVHAVSMSRER